MEERQTVDKMLKVLGTTAKWVAFTILLLFLLYPILLYFAPLFVINTLLAPPLKLVQLLTNQVMDLTGLRIWHARAIAITFYAAISSYLIGIINYPVSYPKFLVKKEKRTPLLILIVLICIILGFAEQRNFSVSTGEPMKKYYISSTGEIELMPLEWNYHPTYGDELNLINREIIQKHEEQQERRESKTTPPPDDDTSYVDPPPDPPKDDPSPTEPGITGTGGDIPTSEGDELAKGSKLPEDSAINTDNTTPEGEQAPQSELSEEEQFNQAFKNLVQKREEQSSWEPTENWGNLLSYRNIEIRFTKSRQRDAAEVVSRLNNLNANVTYILVTPTEAGDYQRNINYRYGDLETAQALQNIVSDIETTYLRRREVPGKKLTLWLY